jgi:hypothetical protein
VKGEKNEVRAEVFLEVFDQTLLRNAVHRHGEKDQDGQGRCRSERRGGGHVAGKECQHVRHQDKQKERSDEAQIGIRLVADDFLNFRTDGADDHFQQVLPARHFSVR